MAVDNSAVSDMSASSAQGIRPLRARYWLVAVLPLVAVVCVVMWGFSTLVAVSATAEGFSRGDVPGEVTIRARPGTWYVYSEGGAAVNEVSVLAPNGSLVPVTMTAAGPGYDWGGVQGYSVGTFEVPVGMMGSYRIVVKGSGDEFGNGNFAVGTFDIASFVIKQQWGMLALLVVNIGAGLAIAFVPIIRRRHRRRVAAASVP
ncbi:MAG: hypothetical protein WCI74_05950 [Actinomycetes bacterium]